MGKALLYKKTFLASFFGGSFLGREIFGSERYLLR